jgi:hypothetical protein
VIVSAFAGGPAGVARRGEVERAPVELDRAGLAGEAGPELIEYPLDLTQDVPVPLGLGWVIGRMHGVLVKGDRIWYFHRAGPDRHVQPKVVERRHRVGVEVAHGPAQPDGAPLAALGVDVEHVVDEVEIHLEGTRSVRDGRSPQAPGGKLEGDLPPVVHHRLQRQRDLTDDLGVHVQRVVRGLPIRDREGRPALPLIRHLRP